MKIWTGKYWMTDKHTKKISSSLKKYFKKNTVWNKGNHNPTYEEPAAKRFRKDEKYYIKELELNAIRSKEKNYYLKNPNRGEQIKKAYKEKQELTGAGRKAKKWGKLEIEYLEKNYLTMPVVDMALNLNRSWGSINHKLSRLGLIYYNKWN